jgi:hypothetical protein
VSELRVCLSDKRVIEGVQVSVAVQTAGLQFVQLQNVADFHPAVSR